MLQPLTPHPPRGTGWLYLAEAHLHFIQTAARAPGKLDGVAILTRRDSSELLRAKLAMTRSVAPMGDFFSLLGG